jgi:hypothetical protein
MRIVFRLIFLSVLLTCYQSNVFADSCDFEEYESLYKVESAQQNSVRDFIEKRSVIYVVATGFGPTRPQLENKNKLTACILEEYWEKQVVLWTGADEHGSCNNQKRAIQKATDYASLYNKHLIKLLKESGHQCFN